MGRQRLIRTSSRWGYRFVGSIRVQAGAEPAAGRCGKLSEWAGSPAARQAFDRGAAVHNMSGDPEQEYFADGMVEDIITALSRFKSLFVIARN